MRSLGLALVAAGLTVLGLSTTPAHAAMCIDIETEPARPVEQMPTRVIAREQWAAITGDRFDLVARRDDRPDIPIRLSRQSAGALTWIGELVFPEAGEWKVRVAIAAADNHFPCFERSVTVVSVGSMARGSSDGLSGIDRAVLALTAAFGLAAVIGIGVLRRSAFRAP